MVLLEQERSSLNETVFKSFRFKKTRELRGNALPIVDMRTVRRERGLSWDTQVLLVFLGNQRCYSKSRFDKGEYKKSRSAAFQKGIKHVVFAHQWCNEHRISWVSA